MDALTIVLIIAAAVVGALVTFFVVKGKRPILVNWSNQMLRKPY